MERRKEAKKNLFSPKCHSETPKERFSNLTVKSRCSVILQTGGERAIGARRPSFTAYAKKVPLKREVSFPRLAGD